MWNVLPRENPWVALRDGRRSSMALREACTAAACRPVHHLLCGGWPSGDSTALSARTGVEDRKLQNRPLIGALALSGTGGATSWWC